jgi:hypothetical protein
LALFTLIFNITADEMGIPEAIGYNLIPAAKRVMGILLFALPVCIGFILIISHKISHQIVGPFDRILRELDENWREKRGEPIRLRKGDKFQPLVERINRLIAVQVKDKTSFS